MSVLGDILDFLKKLVAEILSTLSEGADNIIAQGNAIFTLKSEVEADFEKLKTEIAQIFVRVAAAKKDFGNLKTKLVRADIAYELIHDVFDGELRKFVLQGFGEARSTIVSALQEVHSFANDAGVAGRNSSQAGLSGAIGKILETMNKLILIWKTIGKIVQILHGIVPVLEAFAKKLEHFEKIILSQKSKPTYISARFHYQSRAVLKDQSKYKGVLADSIVVTAASEEEERVHLQQLLDELAQKNS